MPYYSSKNCTCIKLQQTTNRITVLVLGQIKSYVRYKLRFDRYKYLRFLNNFNWENLFANLDSVDTSYIKTNIFKKHKDFLRRQ